MPKKPIKQPVSKKMPAAERRRRLAILTGRPAYAYLVLALVALFGSVLFWSISSAHLQNQDADQLVDPMLFSTSDTFHKAIFPSTHSFLLKWPLFWIVSLFGTTAGALTAMTVGVSLVTVALLVFVVSRIERRPLVLGTICLGLTSVLMLIPAVPTAGALLPVNLAMLTTRNMEYIVYLGILVLLVRAPRLKSWPVAAAVIIFSLLAASDRLFLYLGVIGSFLALVVSALRANNRLVRKAVQWFVISVLAAIGMLLILGLIRWFGVTGFNSSTAEPFGLTSSLKYLVLGLIYGVLGLFTNFGANPAFGGTELRTLPATAWSHLWSASGPTYLINAAILLFVVYHAGRLLMKAFRPSKGRDELGRAENLALYLIWSTIAALGLFVGTNHYYAVDARYLTIALFMGAVVAAVYARSRLWSPTVLLIAGAVFAVAAVLAIPAQRHDTLAHQAVLTPYDYRNQKILDVLKGHPVSHLLGDYWRVVPIAQAAGRHDITPIPMASCDQLLTTLTSTAWQTNWHDQSFAYLLSMDAGLTGYAPCSLAKVEAAYGRPTASVLIAGSYEHPKEYLLFYDGGHQADTSKSPATPDSTITPVSFNEISGTSCNGPGIMNVVAHEDDDLLFMNPDLIHSLKRGYCVRTVYLTAGDAGQGSAYWLGRERGAEAAYDQLDGPGMDIWVQRTVRLNSHEYITVASPRANPKLSLIFLHLPDGGLKGNGFAATGNQSLGKLLSGAIPAIQAVDGQSTYTRQDVVDALATIMRTYLPTEIHTQATKNMSGQFPDHSDHLAVGRLAALAYHQYETIQYDNVVAIPLKAYIGYPIRDRAGNIDGADLQAKTDAFLAYAGYDGSVCRSVSECLHTPTYGAYLARQYQAQ